MKDPIRILVGGIGNVFLGDDGFGVEVVTRLPRRLPAGVHAVDFGIRGVDLAYALCEFDAAILIDVAARGGDPGTLYVLEPEIGGADAPADAHGLTPERVLRWIGAGSAPPTLRLVACEPESFGAPGIGREGLSEPVEAAVEEAVAVVLGLVQSLQASGKAGPPHA